MYILIYSIKCSRIGNLLRWDAALFRQDLCRANVAHIRQSRPDSGLGLKVKVLKTFQGIPSSLENALAGLGLPSFSKPETDSATSSLNPRPSALKNRQCGKGVRVHVAKDAQTPSPFSHEREPVNDESQPARNGPYIQVRRHPSPSYATPPLPNS